MKPVTEALVATDIPTLADVVAAKRRLDDALARIEPTSFFEPELRGSWSHPLFPGVSFLGDRSAPILSWPWPEAAE